MWLLYHHQSAPLPITGGPPSPAMPSTSSSAAMVHVAVGRSTAKTLALLQWTFRQFGCREVGLIHVHHPSVRIPTLLGKLPEDQASKEVVAAYRDLERKEMEKIVQNYQSHCHKSQVQPKIIVTEAGHVEKGIADVITSYGICKLVMGATSDTCFKVKGRSDKVKYIDQNTPSFCEIWFVSKGKHLWTREASEGINDCYSYLVPNETILRQRISSSSLQNCRPNSALSSEYIGLNPSITTQLQGDIISNICEPNNAEVDPSTTENNASFGDQTTSQSPASMVNKAPCLTLASENNSLELYQEMHEELELEGTYNRLPELVSEIETSKEEAFTEPTKRKELESNIAAANRFQEGVELDGVYNRLQELQSEIRTSKEEAFTEQTKRKELESNIAEAANKAKVLDASTENEAKTSKQLQEILIKFKMQHREIASEKCKAMEEIQNAKSSIALLDGHAKELACHGEQAAGDLEAIHSSIGGLMLERQKTQEQWKNCIPFSEMWRCSTYSRSANCNTWLGFASSVDLMEFSALELRTATCGFAESFKLEQGGHECVYKGEILNKTVVIKKFHLHNVQGRKEFQQEVRALGKLQHPHLVKLVGVCSELLSLVYEYLSNGTLLQHLFRRTTTPLTWKVRCRIIAEISNALVFLHSSKPESIIHGNLKPDNVFLDSNLNCKIGDFGLCRFFSEDTSHTVFHHSLEPDVAFPYTDPEYQRTGVLTPKSDVYSFGIIILQLLTRRQPLGLVNEVFGAVQSGTLSLILDTTAGNWPADVATKLAKFGLTCCEMSDHNIPDLTPETVRELEQLHLMEERPVPPFFLCPILQEIMLDPQVAADGFTYERSALKDWIKNGRETSPMTNLKLDNLNLTPNHALRFAIQDWLCQPSRS